MPLTYGEIVVFTHDLEFEVEGWASLSSYLIGIQLGVQGIVNGTEGMQVVSVPETDQLLLMLARKRFDIAVIPRTVRMMYLDRMTQQDPMPLDIDKIKILEPSLEKDALFHYLHSKHQELVPKLTEVLITMEKEGETQRIIKSALVEFSENY